jgi:hypothetical protein
VQQVSDSGERAILPHRTVSGTPHVCRINTAHGPTGQLSAPLTWIKAHACLCACCMTATETSPSEPRPILSSRLRTSPLGSRLVPKVHLLVVRVRHPCLSVRLTPAKPSTARGWVRDTSVSDMRLPPRPASPPPRQPASKHANFVGQTCKKARAYTRHDIIQLHQACMHACMHHCCC